MVQTANKHWAMGTSKAFDPKVVEDIYKELSQDEGVREKIVVLELSSYLEQ